MIYFREIGGEGNLRGGCFILFCVLSIPNYFAHAKIATIQGDDLL